MSTPPQRRSIAESAERRSASFVTSIASRMRSSRGGRSACVAMSLAGRVDAASRYEESFQSARSVASPIPELTPVMKTTGLHGRDAIQTYGKCLPFSIAPENADLGKSWGLFLQHYDLAAFHLLHLEPEPDHVPVLVEGVRRQEAVREAARTKVRDGILAASHGEVENSKELHHDRRRRKTGLRIAETFSELGKQRPPAFGQHIVDGGEIAEDHPLIERRNFFQHSRGGAEINGIPRF